MDATLLPFIEKAHSLPHCLTPILPHCAHFHTSIMMMIIRSSSTNEDSRFDLDMILHLVFTCAPSVPADRSDGSVQLVSHPAPKKRQRGFLFLPCFLIGLIFTSSTSVWNNVRTASCVYSLMAASCPAAAYSTSPVCCSCVRLLFRCPFVVVAFGLTMAMAFTLVLSCRRADIEVISCQM